MKKIIALVLVAVLTVCCLAGCGNKTENKQPKEFQTKELVMATNATFPPYEYYENDRIVGIDAEIAQAIADKLGYTLKIEDMEFDSILAAVQSGKVTMGMAGMTVTEDRKAIVDFSNTYATAVQSVIVKADGDIKTLDDVAGKKIGVQTSTTGDIYATDDYGEENIERYSKGTDAVAALVAGKIDCVIIDNEPAKAYVAANEGLTILDTAYAEEQYAIAFAKTNPLVKDAVNGALVELINDGTIKKIIEKYIPAEEVPAE